MFLAGGHFDFNKANICFVHQTSLPKLNISVFGYRLIKSKLNEQIVMIIPDESIHEQILAIPLELKASLKL